MLLPALQNCKKIGQNNNMENGKEAPKGYSIRPPRQARSVESWRRILDAARELIEEGGTSALTLSALCERAKVAPTTVYQRVDSMNALLYAVYLDGMHELENFTHDLVLKSLKLPDRSPERVQKAIDAVGDTFTKHAQYLKAITEYSVRDEGFWQEEVRDADHFVEDLIDAISFGNRQAAFECVDMIFTENMVRILFGPHWMGRTAEAYPQFRKRLFRMVWARLNFDQ